MRFQSAARPEESGELALSTDGTFRVEPSEAMIEAVADLEHKAVERAGRVSTSVALTLIGLGLCVAAIGWFSGRFGGKLRERVTSRRRVDKIKLQYQTDAGVRVEFQEPLAGSISLGWSPGEYDDDEASRFADAYERMRKRAADEGLT
jgi:hypothetical protein